MTAPELRPLVNAGRLVRAEQIAPLTVATPRSLFLAAVHAGNVWSVESDGRIVRMAHGAATGRTLGADLVGEHCRAHRVGVDPDDVHGRPVTDDPETVATVAAEVAALARANAARSRRLTTKSVAQMLAERLVIRRAPFVRNGAVWWRWAAPGDPVTGRGMPGQPAAQRSGRVGLPSSPLAALRRESEPADDPLVTADVVWAAVEGERLLQPDESAPPWPDVVRALRVLAGLPAEPAAGAGDGTKWLRRSRS